MTTPLLAVLDLTMRFGGVVALNQVTFDVTRGSVTALIGPNGAGKTTVFNCITGFYRASAGRIRLHGTNGHEVDLIKILGGALEGRDLLHPGRLAERLYYKMFGGAYLATRAGVVRTFQNVRLFKEMTVMENLLVAQRHRLHDGVVAGLLQTPSYRRAEEEAVERGWYWLDFFGLSREGNRLAGVLPYGQQRRLEIARALCVEPRLLCLDEPAAGLNPNETRELSGLIRQLRDERGLTVCLIEHDMGLVMEISDHVVVLDHGQVIARGTPRAVRDDPVVLEAYLGAPEEEAA
ncbi:MAG: ATP-binding cassette domain-containing protein [Magnetococcales bacterium]|nr:ATP-binding cassette domain-containing protein [Magnetococcales bacterium]